MKRKFIILIITICMLLSSFGLFAACNRRDDGKINIVVTVFPEYDWVNNVIKDESGRFNVKLLQDSGVDLHNYEPTIDDMASIVSCDLFIYVGGESDEWVEGVFKNSKGDIQTINLLEVLGDKAKEEETIEGMEVEHEENHEESELDEHVWLSLRNAQLFVTNIAEKLSIIDAEKADVYLNNAKEYNAKLNALDIRYIDEVSDCSGDTLLFGDRFPFRYLVDDYNLKYYAAFAGCSTESNASFTTIVFLADKVDEIGLKSIIVIDGSDEKVAAKIKQETSDKDQIILRLNSIQSTTLNDYNKGITYLSIMENNLGVLKLALDY